MIFGITISPESVSASEIDINGLMRRIESPKALRAAQDLLGDWERQGFVSQLQIDRLAVVRQLSPSDLAELMTFVQGIGGSHDEEPDDDELRSIETLESDEIDAATQAAAQPSDEKYPSDRLLTYAEVSEFARALRLGRQASDTIVPGEPISDQMRQIIARGEAARQSLIVCNLRLVHSTAKHYLVHPAFPYEDLVQEGTLGLMKAVERFDPEKGFKFSTYAKWWIRQSILRALANRAATIRVPVHRAQEIFKYKRTVELLRQEGDGAEPSLVEIAEALQWNIDKVLSIQQLSEMAYVSMNDSVGDENDETEFGDLMSADLASPLEQFDAKERRGFVEEVLLRLSPQERDIISRRYGLATFGIGETLADIGDDYHLTRERIRQIQAGAIKKMGPAAKRWISKGVSD